MDLGVGNLLSVAGFLGSFMDPNAIHELFKDVYGAFVNTDGFTVGAAAETHAAFIIVRVLLLLI